MIEPDRSQIWAFLAAGVLLAITVAIADVTKIYAALVDAEKDILLVGVLLGVGVLFVRSRVWLVIFDAMGTAKGTLAVFQLFSVGEFLNNITPFGQAGGQPLMAYVVYDETEIQYEESLAAVMSGDMFTAVPLVTFGVFSGVFLFINNALTELVLDTLVFSLSVILGIFLLLVRLTIFPEERFGVVDTLREHVSVGDRIGSFLIEKIGNMREVFRIVGGNPTHIVRAALFAHLALLADVTVLYVVLSSFDVSVNPLYLTAIFPVSNLSKLLPTPGGSGGYEFVLATFLTTIAGVNFAVSVSAVILYRVATYWVAIVLGYVFISRLGLSIPEHIPRND
jgi:uncharacterized protein (TIRG00374 family)